MTSGSVSATRASRTSWGRLVGHHRVRRRPTGADRPQVDAARSVSADPLRARNHHTRTAPADTARQASRSQRGYGATLRTTRQTRNAATPAHATAAAAATARSRSLTRMRPSPLSPCLAAGQGPFRHLRQAYCRPPQEAVPDSGSAGARLPRRSRSAAVSRLGSSTRMRQDSPITTTGTSRCRRASPRCPTPGPAAASPAALSLFLDVLLRDAVHRRQQGLGVRCRTVRPTSL